jgi:hypothetical protein
MGPKRGGKQWRQTRHEPRRDRGKTWNEEGDSVEASLSRLKVRNEKASSGAEEEEEQRLLKHLPSVKLLHMTASSFIYFFIFIF